MKGVKRKVQLLFKKALLDICKNGKRTILAFVAITLGMIFFGIMLFSDVIINREIRTVYQASNPASAVIQVNGDADADKIRQIAESFDEIQEYEIKAVTTAQIKMSENSWKQAYIFGIPGKGKTINKINITEGELTYNRDKCLIETGAVSVAGADIGDDIFIRTDSGIEKSYTITGTANDMSVHPAFVHGCVYLYIPLEIMKKDQINGYFLDIRTTKPYEKKEIDKVSQQLVTKLKEADIQISEIEVPENPGESMHAGEYDSTMFLLRLFSFVALLFGSMIIANLMSAIMDTQIKQIGILKSIGAKVSRIFAAYLLAFTVLFTGCVLIAAVVVNVSSGYLSILFLKLSDIIPGDTSISIGWNVLFMGVSLIIPLIIVTFPLIKGSKITVKQAFDDTGIAADKINSSVHLKNIKNRVLSLSIRNVFRKKKRFALNIGLLTFGGVIFISIITVYLSLQCDLDSYMESLKYDYQFQIGENGNEQELTSKLNDIEGLDEYEIWGNTYCSYMSGDGIENMCQIIAPQYLSKFIVPKMTEGAWYDDYAQDDSHIVISEELASEQNWKLGEKVTLSLTGQNHEFIVGGILKEFEKQEIYMPQSLLEQYVEKEIWTYSVKCRTGASGISTRKYYEELTGRMEKKGIAAVSGESRAQMKSVLMNHFAVTLNSCLVVSVLLVIVSGFGLSASMSIQAEERKKEIGILKAIGARTRKIKNMLQTEGNVLSLVGFLVTIPAGLLVALGGCEVFGDYVFDKAIQFDIISFLIACGIWFAFSFVITCGAVRGSAKRSARLTIKEVLG